MNQRESLSLLIFFLHIHIWYDVGECTCLGLVYQYVCYIMGSKCSHLMHFLHWYCHAVYMLDVIFPILNQFYHIHVSSNTTAYNSISNEFHLRYMFFSELQRSIFRNIGKNSRWMKLNIYLFMHSTYIKFIFCEWLHFIVDLYVRNLL